MGLADFAGANSNGWPTGPVSIKKKSKLSQLAIRWNFEPAKSANPTRFLSKIDQQLIEGAGDIFQRPREKKPAKVLKNPLLFSGTIVVGLNKERDKRPSLFSISVSGT